MQASGWAEDDVTILVIGESGQLARALALRGGNTVQRIGRSRLDLSDLNFASALRAVRRPDVIINTAAYTAVDLAESDADVAYAVNHRAVAVLADFAASANVPLIHVSTDYVFSGTVRHAYREDDLTGPTGVYGASKLAGEAALAASAADYAIVRTAWLYAPYGHNFVRTMLRLARDRDTVRVVADQIGSPTSALDLADVLLAMVARWPSGGVRACYHAVNAGQSSWADFAAAIYAEADRHGLPSATVTPIATADYPTAAQRPAFSLLDCEKLTADFGITLRAWPDALAAMFADPDYRAALSA